MSDHTPDNLREGEVALPFNPAERATDAGLVFIGHVRSPWMDRKGCPKNVADARATGQQAHVVLDPAWRPGLTGLKGYSHIALITWLDRSQRNLIIQKPVHAPETRGVFALRSPVRPNPIGLHVVRLLSVDIDAGRLELEAIDVLDGTPVIDIKPYFASVDAVPDATRPERL